MRGLVVGLLAGSALVLASGAALAEGKQNFTLVNKTGYTLDEVYVAPSKSNSWEEDVMGRDVLADGETVDIEFARSEKTCMWDLKVVYDDKSSAEWDHFDLCKTSKITIKWDRSSGETSAEYE